ncbi:MAG: MiaB/RimO family radical SAM methylthiotransferase [Elusimicrobia bacterium]|nr:MiaB/RimO family radical SAM methylthiotransferase [Elusimicrobiota bacterium]
MTVKCFFKTFGCRVNQYETQSLRERLLAAEGAVGVEDWQSADLCVINTCSVTAEADKDALRLIRRIAARNARARLVVTGCLAEHDAGALAKAAPKATIVGNRGKDGLAVLLGLGPAGAPGGRVTRWHGRSRALVKVQDGCDGACSYCVVPQVRGVLSSKPLEALVEEVSGLVAGGHAEIVLCGVRLGRYEGEAGGAAADLAAALERLARLDGDFRLRLSSLEVAELSDRLLDAAAGSGGRVCPSFHLPLQSGSEAVLRRMKRPYAAERFARRLEALRRRLPGAGVFTDIMAGFPGETESEFEESLAFVRGLRLSGLHVFRYSRRRGTAAASMPGQVPAAAAVERAVRLRELDRELRSAFAAAAVGSVRRVVATGDPRSQDCEALAEDFLPVVLDRSPGPGIHRARVVSSDGPSARGVVG